MTYTSTYVLIRILCWFEIES